MVNDLIIIIAFCCTSAVGVWDVPDNDEEVFQDR